MSRHLNPRPVRRLAIASLLTLAALVASACGGTATTAAPAPTEAPPATAAPAPTEAPAATEAPAPTEAPTLSGTMVHMTWGGNYTKADRSAFLEPFSQETGVQIETVDAPGEQLTKLQAMADAGSVTVDTIDLGAEDAYQAWTEGLLEPLPADLKAEIVAIAGEGAVTDYGVSIASYALVVVCNLDAAEKCPVNAVEFWDVQNFPGPRAMYRDGWQENMIYALLADGVAKADIFPIDVDRAINKLDEIKPNINVWWSSGDQSQQIFRDEEVVMGILWDGRASKLPEQGVNVSISFDGGMYSDDKLVVAKDAPNKEAAFAYLLWYASNPEAQAEWIKLIGYGTVNPEAYDLIDAETRQYLAEAPENRSLVVPIDMAWVAEHGAAAKEAWYAWLGE